ncbi:MAG: hypothetical protein QXX08_03905 [Candidatus Bathyarchaeia archaeon]
MSEQKKFKVHLEFGEAKADFEGDADQVFKLITRFLTQIYPNLEVLQRILFTPDLARLAEKLSNIVEIIPEGPITAPGLDLSARNAICFVLLGAYVGNKFGKLSKDALSSNELSRFTGKARKTISNELPKLVAEGLVERTTEGEYRITTLGIRKTEETIEIYKLK